MATICRRYSVGRLELFGPALLLDFEPIEATKVFGEFSDKTTKGPLKRYMNPKFELQTFLKKPVDLVEPNFITNPYFAEAAAKRRVAYVA